MREEVGYRYACMSWDKGWFMYIYFYITPVKKIGILATDYPRYGATNDAKRQKKRRKIVKINPKSKEKFAQTARIIFGCRRYWNFFEVWFIHMHMYTFYTCIHRQYKTFNSIYYYKNKQIWHDKCIPFCSNPINYLSINWYCHQSTISCLFRAHFFRLLFFCRFFSDLEIFCLD